MRHAAPVHAVAPRVRRAKRRGLERAFYSSLAATAVLVACHDERTPAERGAAIFERTCAGCHGADGRGTHPPGFTTPPRNLTDPELQTRLSDAMIKETIRYGKGQMPNFGGLLADSDLDALVRYVRTLRSDGKR